VGLAAFLTAALESALHNGVATPDDVLRHATPDVLAAHVPRPVWSRLIKTCLEAPRVDARLVVETIGMKTLCDTVPPNIMYGCLAEIAMRALGKGLVASPPASVVAASAPVMPSGAPVSAMPPISRMATPPHGTRIDASGRVATPPAGATTAAAAAAKAAVASGTPPKGTTPDPASEVTRVAHPPAELSKIAAEKDVRGEPTRVGAPPREPEPQPLGEPPAPPSRGPGATTRANQATQPPTGGRRPQASAGAAQIPPTGRETGANAKLARGTPTSARRVSTATDFEIETDVNEQWKRTGQQPPASGSGAIDIQVDEVDLVDWSSSEETATNNDKYGKR
jgi:hypothetical protein